MSLPWVAEERRRQEALHEAVGARGSMNHRRIGAVPEPLGPTGPWTFAALVGWWLRAGHALHAVSESGRRQLADHVGRTPGDGEYPPLWLAARYAALHLPPDGLPQELARSKTWQAHGESLPVYVVKLLTWVTSRDRPRTPDIDPVKKPNEWVDFLAREFSTVLQDASALLGERVVLEAGDEVSWRTLGEWLPAWNGKIEGLSLRCVRRPLINVVGERRDVLIKGLVVLPLPGTLIKRLHGSLRDGRARVARAGSPRGDYVSRAVQSAAERSPTDRLFSAVFSEALQQQPRSAALVEQSFLPLARVLGVTVAETRGDTKPGAGDQARVCEHLTNLRLALALDGFEVRPGVPPPDDGGRMIPHRGCPGQRREALSFTYRAKDASSDVPVGWLGEPATCDEALLAAIEDVDWRLWALQHAPWDEATAPVAAIVVQAAKPSTWEPLKRRILLEPTVAEAACELFDFAHARRLDFDMLAGRVGNTATAVSLDAFIRDYAAVARVAFERLLAIDPGTPARLDPPRLVDGTVDVGGWLARKRRGEPGSASWLVDWVRDARPTGTVVAELREEKHHVVKVSAGSMSDDDLAILRLEPVPNSSGDGAESAGLLRKTLVELQAAVGAEFAKGSADVDVAGALAALRRALAADRAAAFHELVERWRSGDTAAAAWGRVLAADRRFGFACHPRFDPASGAVAPAAAEDVFLEWACDERVPAGQDMAITFALEPDRARRVISRGRRLVGSPADHAEALVTAAGRHEPLATLARQALRATDRWTHFAGSAPHPRLAARRLLDALLDERAAPAEVRAGVFAAARRWCAAIGHEIVPADWAPDGAVRAEALADEGLRHEFHATAPRGTVIVRGFGLRGPDGVSFTGAISAGPAPSGFAALEEAARALAGTGSSWEGVTQRIDDLAKHASSDTLALAGSNLFDMVWQAAEEVPEGQARHVEALQAGVLAFLKEACRMLPFEPSAIGDYPTAWLREADGRQPRGRRIRRVVRPGLRTKDNTLVRPALVVTE